MLLGRIFRRSHFDTGIKLFSGNSSLLETFSQVTCGVSSRGTPSRIARRLLAHLTVVEANTVASDPESKGRLPAYSKSLLTAEPAAEFNDTRGFQSFDEPHKFRAGEVPGIAALAVLTQLINLRHIDHWILPTRVTTVLLRSTRPTKLNCAQL